LRRWRRPCYGLWLFLVPDGLPTVALIVQHDVCASLPDMSAKSCKAHRNRQFLCSVRIGLSAKGKCSLDHNNIVRDILLAAKHRAPPSLQLPQYVPLHMLEFSSRGAFYWHSNENSHQGQQCLVRGLAKVAEQMKL
jgi:hypothetical protein